jgi:hypothetical protein
MVVVPPKIHGANLINRHLLNINKPSTAAFMPRARPDFCKN